MTAVNCANCGESVDITEDGYVEIAKHKKICKAQQKRMIIS